MKFKDFADNTKNMMNLNFNRPQVGVRREGTMRLKNCCAKKKDPPMQMKILKNDVLEDLKEEDEDIDEEDAVFK